MFRAMAANEPRNDNKLSRDVNMRHVILNQMKDARRTWLRLNAYWKSRAGKKRTMRIFASITQ